jgi:histone chaperone ASF1
MSVVSLLGVNVLNNPAKFGDSYQFEITFECLEALKSGMMAAYTKKLQELTLS